MSEYELVNKLLTHDAFGEEVSVTKNQIIARLSNSQVLSELIAAVIEWGYKFYIFDNQIHFFRIK